MQGTRIRDYIDMPYLWKIENMYLAGHPTIEAIEDLSSKGLKTIINMRQPGEQDYTELINRCKSLGLNYHHLPIMGELGLDENICTEISSLVKDDEAIMIHCASANRVGGWLITYLVLNKGIDFDDAIDIAMENGLSNPGFVPQAKRVIDLKA